VYLPSSRRPAYRGHLFMLMRCVVYEIVGVEVEVLVVAEVEVLVVAGVGVLSSILECSVELFLCFLAL